MVVCCDGIANVLGSFDPCTTIIEVMLSSILCFNGSWYTGVDVVVSWTYYYGAWFTVGLIG